MEYSIIGSLARATGRATDSTDRQTQRPATASLLAPLHEFNSALVSQMGKETQLE